MDFPQHALVVILLVRRYVCSVLTSSTWFAFLVPRLQHVQVDVQEVQIGKQWWSWGHASLDACCASPCISVGPAMTGI